MEIMASSNQQVIYDQAQRAARSCGHKLLWKWHCMCGSCCGFDHLQAVPQIGMAVIVNSPRLFAIRHLTFAEIKIITSGK
jgi:hypothetical protein